MKIETIKLAISKTAGRGGLLLKKHSPEILMAAGVVGIVTSTVMACKATLKVDSVLEEAKQKKDKIDEAWEKVKEGEIALDDYSEKDHNKDLVVVKVQTAVSFVKLYGPAVTLGVASIACILGAHGIMRKRNLALVAAYKAIEQSFVDYRNRVIEEFGADKDRDYKTGIRRTLVNELDDKGKPTKKVKVVETQDPNAISQYARFFDESSTQWSKTPEYNLTFLKCQQNYANDLLHSRGHIFLNEVYDMIGVPRTQAGAIVGWVKGEGDEFVDFGIFDGDNMKTRDFVNGYERSILLDFNVAGVIYDMI